MPESRGKAASDPPKRDDSSIDHETNTGSFEVKYKLDTSYKIDSFDLRERIGHGQLLINNEWEDVSFLLCSSIKEQQNIYRNLASIGHDSTVKVKGWGPLPESLKIGRKEVFLIAIERVSSTLNQFLERFNENFWTQGNLHMTIQQIVRDMTDGMTSIHGKDKVHGRKTKAGFGITALDFVMVEDKVKFAFVHADNKMDCAGLAKLKRLDGRDLMKLLKIILRDPNKNPELDHFLKQNFERKLRFHPMLWGPAKKFHFPVTIKMKLDRVPGIQDRFKSLKTPGVEELKTKPWSDCIPQGTFYKIYKYRESIGKPYDPCCAYSRYEYIRNVCAHYHGYTGQGFSPENVVVQLNQMFPAHLCDIYEVLDINSLEEYF